jgi:AcrR family transcriptional regulator
MTRDELLPLIIDELAGNGLSGRSLRDIAAAVGTSHRMLIHHFGSRAGLLSAVVHAVEAGQRDAAARDDRVDGANDRFAALQRTWQRVSQPTYWPHERLFFECYARALQGEEPFATLLPGLIEDWIEPAVAAQVAHGRPEARARADARLALAVVRGLLLDLLATGDRDGADRAFAEFLALLRARERADVTAPWEPAESGRS